MVAKLMQNIASARYIFIKNMALFNLSSHKGVVSYDENYEK